MKELIEKFRSWSVAILGKDNLSEDFKNGYACAMDASASELEAAVEKWNTRHENNQPQPSAGSACRLN